MSGPERETCGVVTARERIGGSDAPWTEAKCLLPPGHDGTHADWTAWLGIESPDFSRVPRPPETWNRVHPL